MSSPQVAPQTLGEIITMAVAPVFLISSLIAYLGVLSARSTRIVDNLLVLQASDADLEWTANKLVDLEVGNFVGAHCTGLEPVYRLRGLANLDRSTAVVGATGATFTLADGIEPLSLAR